MKPRLQLLDGQTGPPSPRRHQRALELRELDDWRKRARRYLSTTCGADYVTLTQLDDLVERLRGQLWRGV